MRLAQVTPNQRINERMRGPVKLSEGEDNWVTHMGLVYGGERVIFRGKDLFEEFRNSGWMELFLFGITGKRFDKKQIQLFESLWVLSTSYPDPRIWNNRIASLAGTARSTGALGISAAIAVSEARIYGFKPIIGAFDLITTLTDRSSKGEDFESLVLTELQKSRTLPGYARPLTSKDERIRPLSELATELGFSGGRHVNTAWRIESILMDHRYRMRMNVAALAAALAADQGLSRSEYYHYVIPCFVAGMVPCHIEASMRPAGVFLPIRCNSLIYKGKSNRKWGGTASR